MKLPWGSGGEFHGVSPNMTLPLIRFFTERQLYICTLAVIKGLLTGLVV
jgi:hypothetical protein